MLSYALITNYELQEINMEIEVRLPYGEIFIMTKKGVMLFSVIRGYSSCCSRKRMRYNKMRVGSRTPHPFLRSLW